MSIPPAVRQILAGLPADDLARLSDADLLARFAANRDETAFAALVERHGPLVIGICRRILGHRQDSEDAAQAVFLVLARKGKRIRKSEALSAWLHGVAVRTSHKALSRRRRTEPLPHTLTAQERLDPSWADARRVIDAALATLPESLRVPLLLCYLEGLTRDEAASRLGLSIDTFRGRLERGRQKLRDVLARRGFPLAAGLLVVLLESPTYAAPEWIHATAAFALGTLAPPPTIASLAAGASPMRLSRYWLVSGLCAALACGGALWAGTAPPPAAPASKPAALVAADEPIPLLPKDRTGVWRSVVISKGGNMVYRHAIRFTGPNELVWDSKQRAPGVDGGNGTRAKYELTDNGKLRLTPLALLGADGIEWDPFTGRKWPPYEYTILPLDKECRSFQLVQMDARGRTILDAVFRHEVDVVPKVDPLVPEYLTKIDRTIKKEPKYVNKPKYVLLAFGPKAEFKVWVVIDGDTAYIDRNGNGDLTEEGELCKPWSTEGNVVRQAIGELTYRLPGTKRTVANIGWYHSEQGRTGGSVGAGNENHISQFAGISDGIGLNYAPTPAQAAVIHFGGEIITFKPWRSVSIVNKEKRLVETFPASLDANKESWVAFKVGTPGVGAGHREFGEASFAAFSHTDEGTRGSPSLLPKGISPVAEYEFTPLNPADGVKKVKVKLSEHLNTTSFCGRIAVPPGVKTGLDAAKVTLSFPDSPWGTVKPVTLAVDVIPKK